MTYGDPSYRFKTPEHALIGGMLWGYLMKQGIDIHVIDDQGEFTPHVLITLPFEGRYWKVEVVVEDVHFEVDENGQPL